MNILITRPLIDAEDMMQKLFSSGHKIFHLPTLKITSNNATSINSDDYDAFIFTSANAIRYLNLKNNNKKIQCFCVGTMTEKIARQNGFTNTISAGGTVNALKNLILISDKVNKKSKLDYFCGDHISYDLEGELKKEGFQIDKIINYQSTKITELNNENKNLLDQYPPDLVYIYSLRSAESFIDIVKNYSLTQLMTHSKVMCISEKIAKAFKLVGWNKIEVFNPGEELLRI